MIVTVLFIWLLSLEWAFLRPVGHTATWTRHVARRALEPALVGGVAMQSFSAETAVFAYDFERISKNSSTSRPIGEENVLGLLRVEIALEPLSRKLWDLESTPINSTQFHCVRILADVAVVGGPRFESLRCRPRFKRSVAWKVASVLVEEGQWRYRRGRLRSSGS